MIRMLRGLSLNILAAVLVIGLAGCNLSSGGVTGNTPPAALRPVVVINSPANGSSSAVGQQILVSTTATDAVGISRVQLLANGVVVKTINSESATGDRTLNALLDFTPQVAGQLQLQVIAYRASTASLPVGITVTIGQATAQPTGQVTATFGPPPLRTNPPPINPADPTCRALTNTNVNLRQGPDSTQYSIITLLNAGTVVPVTGRIGTNQWYQVRVGNTLGWVSAGFVTLYGTLCASVPVVPVPPTPTPPGQVIITATSIIVPTSTPVPPTSVPPTPVPPTITPGLPDLIVTGVTGPPILSLGAGNTPVVGAFSVTLTNTSGRPSGQFAVSLTISPGGTPQQMGVVANLNPGESIVISGNLTFNAPGSFTVQAMADSGANVNEVSEVNNIGFAGITITPGS